MNLPQEQLRQLLEVDKSVIDIEVNNNLIYPVVPTYDDAKIHLHFWCIHCRNWHLHGRGDKKQPSVGHRVAHCTANNSPFRQNGVILRLIGEFTKKLENEYKNRQLLKCPKCHEFYSAAYNGCACGFVNKRRSTEYLQMAERYQHILKAANSL